jgi:NADH-quinone oxidoreductase subunit E
MLSATSKETIEDLLYRYEKNPRFLLQLLLDVQERFRYVPTEAMRSIARYFDIPESRVFAVATFYKVLSLVPKGEKIIKVCQGTACHLRGGKQVLSAIGEKLGIAAGETTEDGIFTLETVNCLGCCAMAPVMMVGDKVYGKLTVDDVSRILEAEKEDAILSKTR